tara:strand:- start:1160 stop:2095 length:936 start_codon:yes stop_codon:yes gene_type:complete
MPGSARAMALEAGSASHEAFAAVRWYQLKTHQTKGKVQQAIANKHGVRLFGEERFERMYGTLSKSATDRTNSINFAIEAIESCDFYDDLEDRKRTVSNISESIIAYIDAYDMHRYPIWVRDPKDPDSDIGIEIAFDTVVTIHYKLDGAAHELVCRFIGKLDGLHWNREDLIIIEEKTAAVLSDHWLAQWILSHQITGYCIASQTFTNLPCNQALVSGMRIPIGKIPSEGIRREQVPRTHMHIVKWANWFITSVEMENRWFDNVLAAPMYTHSCNRYFRTCSFLPFCAVDTEKEKLDIIEEMELDEWSPLHD